MNVAAKTEVQAVLEAHVKKSEAASKEAKMKIKRTSEYKSAHKPARVVGATTAAATTTHKPARVVGAPTAAATTGLTPMQWIGHNHDLTFISLFDQASPINHNTGHILTTEAFQKHSLSWKRLNY